MLEERAPSSVGNPSLCPRVVMPCVRAHGATLVHVRPASSSQTDCVSAA